MEEWAEFGCILCVVILNAIIGYLQESHAEKEAEALRSMLSLHAVVQRDGVRSTILAEDLVPGDVVFVASGEKVPADARLFAATALHTQESALTGETTANPKRVDSVAADTPLSERVNMLYSGTFVASGQGLAVVIATGVNTELGKISKMVASVKVPETPLTRQITVFGRWLALFIGIVAAVTYAIGFAYRRDPLKHLLTASAIAVAAIPEGLPAIMSMTMAIGVRRLAQRKAILRKLPAVETLGSVSVICSDKTGTLTQNEMTVRVVCTPQGRFMVGGTGYTPHGHILPVRVSPTLDDPEGSLLPPSLAIVPGRITAQAPSSTQSPVGDIFSNPPSSGAPDSTASPPASTEGPAPPDGLFHELALAGVLCNDASLTLQREGEEESEPPSGPSDRAASPKKKVKKETTDAAASAGATQWTLVGDPTEGALLSLAMKAGIGITECQLSHVRRSAIPFESDHGFMATTNTIPENSPSCHFLASGAGATSPSPSVGSTPLTKLFVKGAPEKVFAMCSHQVRLCPAHDGHGPTAETEPLDTARWKGDVEQLGRLGLRVLALAERVMPALRFGPAVPSAPALVDAAPADAAQAEREPAAAGDSASGQEAPPLAFGDVHGLTFLGLVGIFDPPRNEARRSIRRCKEAGVQVIMITGDHAHTAAAIGSMLELVPSERSPETSSTGGRVCTSAELAAMSDEELRRDVRQISVFARSTPADKLRIVQALQHTGVVVAMTGDGVNDSPALAQADVGVAMGKNGTEAAKEAAEIVLADDNFATIVAAVEQGRIVFDNLVRSLLFIMPTNAAQALVLITAIIVGSEDPLNAIQILWVNMITTVTLALPIPFQKGEENVLSRPPRKPRQPLLSATLAFRTLEVGVVSTALMLVFFLMDRHWLPEPLSLEAAQMACANELSLIQIFFAFNCLNLKGSSLTLSIFKQNPALLVAMVIMLGLQVLITYVPALNFVFGTATHPWWIWLRALGCGIVVFLWVEAEKAVLRCFRHARKQRQRAAQAPPPASRQPEATMA